MEINLDELIGQSEKAVKNFIIENNIITYRIIPDGMCTTCEYEEDRLTVWLDENNNVYKIGYN